LARRKEEEMGKSKNIKDLRGGSSTQRKGGFTSVRLGYLRDEIDARVLSRLALNVSAEVIRCIEFTLHGPISPETMARLDACARFEKMTIDGLLQAMLDQRARRH
jgi:hypothetical protein